MNINEEFPSKWLKATDLNGQQPTYTIREVSREDIGDDGFKPVIFFNEVAKGVVLNKTNATNISEAYGPETDAWIGKPVILFTTWVDFQGKSVEAIRIRPGQQNFVSGAATTAPPVDELNPPPAEFPGDR